VIAINDHLNEEKKKEIEDKIQDLNKESMCSCKNEFENLFH
jgi:hypothetical protein